MGPSGQLVSLRHIIISVILKNQNAKLNVILKKALGDTFLSL